MIIVTGGAGFIGSNICADLEAAGHRDIVVVDRLESGEKWRNIAKRQLYDIVSPDAVDRFLAGRRGVEAVIHMGANSSTTATDADAVIESNFRSSARHWVWCAETATPFVYASSAATYGDGAAGFDDDTSPTAMAALRPLNLYGWSKHLFDRWALTRAAEGLAPPQWAGLKFFNVFGPNEAHKGDMRSLVAKNTAVVAAGEPVRLFRSHRAGVADGRQLRDFVYVRDCCDVVSWLLATPSVSGIFNVGTGVPRSFLDLAEAIGAALDRPVSIDFVDMPETIRDQYQYHTQATTTKLRAAGYTKAFGTLEDTVRDYVRNHLVRPDGFR